MEGRETEKQSGRGVYWSRVQNYLMRMEDEKQWEANIQLNVKLPGKALRNHAAINWLSLGTVLHRGQLGGFCCCFVFRFFFFPSLRSIVQITMSRYFT